MLARLLPGALRRLGRRRNGPAAARPDVVVASSGSLAHVYFTSEPGRMTAETIEVRYPGLIEALARHPGIGAVLVRSDAGHAVVLGQNGRLDLTTGRADPASAAAKRGGGAGGGAGGGDPLADYGTRAAENLLHLEAFANAGDVILLGAVDRVSGEVTGFEELIGSHGGLGGWQSEPFIMCPATLTLAEDPPVGAPAIYRQLVAWQAQLRTESGG
jgi:hypothetical protein